MNFYELLARTDSFLGVRNELGWVPAGVIRPRRPDMSLERLERSIRDELYNVDDNYVSHAKALARDLSILLACPPQYTTSWVFSVLTGKGPTAERAPARHVVDGSDLHMLYSADSRSYSPKDLEILLDLANDLRNAAESDARRRLSRLLSREVVGGR